MAWGFSSLLEANHFAIWKFYEGVKNQQGQKKIKFNQYIAGLAPLQRRRNAIGTSHCK